MDENKIRPEDTSSKEKGETQFGGEEPKAPPSPGKRPETVPSAKSAAHDAVERAEREEPPIGGEFDRTPPGFERD